MLSPPTIKAVKITWITLVGYPDGPYPMRRGNCFSVMTEDGGHFRIINFSHEDLEELIRRDVGLPFEIVELCPGVAYIHDPRIPDDWYPSRWCEVCCPADLLPIPQRLAHDRQRKQGVREEKNGCVSIRWHLAPKV